MINRFTHASLRGIGLLLCLTYYFSGQLAAQPIWSEFMKHYEGGDVEYGYGAIQTPDGNFVIAGHLGTVPGNGGDGVLMKLDPGGTQLWTTAYGGTAWEHTRSVKVSRDGGLISAGHSRSFGAGNNDFFVVKTNALGQTQWARAIGGSGEDFAFCVDTTSDGGYVVAGYSNSFGAGNYDFYIVKLDAGGSIQWTRTVGGTLSDNAFNVVQTDDQGYLVSGYTSSFGAGSVDAYLVKLSPTGVVQWTRTYGGALQDFGYRAYETPDGGYIFAGITSSFGAGAQDMFAIRTDNMGVIQWTRTYGSAVMDRAFNVVQTYDGKYILTGETTTNTFGSGDAMMVKVNTTGAIEWAYHYGTAVDETGYGTSVETSDLGILLASWDDNDEDILVTKVDSLGNPKCNFGPAGVVANTPAWTLSSGGVAGIGGAIANITPTETNLPLTEVPYCSNVLPVSLTAFAVRQDYSMQHVEWQVEGERSIAAYVVERADEPGNFRSLGSKAAVNSGGAQVYVFVDAEPIYDMSWYRLAIRDLDGVVTYSKVLRVFAESAPQQPAVRRDGPGMTAVRLPWLQPSADIHWTLTDLLGRRVRQGRYDREWIAIRHRGIGLLRVDAAGSSATFRIRFE